MLLALFWLNSSAV